MIELEHVFDYHALLKPSIWIGKGPLGGRMFAEVTGGEITGPRLNGKLLSGGGDWALLGDDGFGRLDVRGQVETDDGALIYTHYEGLVELTPDVQKATVSGGETQFGDQYWFTTPRFETGDERYRWLTQGIFLARGRVYPSGVAYEVYRAA